VAKRRGADGADWISAGGSAASGSIPLSPLARETWLAVGEVQGMRRPARASSSPPPLEEAEVARLFADRILSQRIVRFRAETGGVEALRQTRLGAITLASGSDDAPDPAEVERALLEGVRAHGLGLLPWSKAALSLRRRAGFAGVEELSDAALLAALDQWLPALLAGKRRLAAIDPHSLDGVLETLLGWEGRKRLDALAPAHFVTPLGHDAPIDYEAPGGPEVEIRVQALFGLADASRRSGRTACRCGSASRRPPGGSIQTTSGPAGLLGRELVGGGEGDARALPEATTGRTTPPRRSGDVAHQTQGCREEILTNPC
jgi:ATP-dependent helicase HrpB